MGTRIMNFIEKSNKVLLFLAAIVVIIAIGKKLVSDLLRKDYSEPTVQVVKQSDTQEEQQKINLEKRYVGQIKDVHILEITSDKIIEEQSFSSNADMIVVSSSLGLSSNAVNLMFTKHGEKSKLLLDSHALIVNFSPVQVKETLYKNILSKNLYSVATADSNNDGFLNKHDNKDLLVSEYDGSKLTSVMANIEGYQIIKNDTLLVYKSVENDTVYYTYSVLTGGLLKLDTSL